MDTKLKLIYDTLNLGQNANCDKPQIVTNRK